MTKPVPDHAGVIAGLLEGLVSTFADGPDHDDNVAKALAMFDALQPANLIDAMKTVSAIASHFTAMDCFALARIPGLGETTAKDLRRTAIYLGGTPG
jgi:stage V sporulation protein SpoVS